MKLRKHIAGLLVASVGFTGLGMASAATASAQTSKPAVTKHVSRHAVTKHKSKGLKTRKAHTVRRRSHRRQGRK
jgi:hypothetical protein